MANETGSIVRVLAAAGLAYLGLRGLQALRTAGAEAEGPLEVSLGDTTDDDLPSLTPLPAAPGGSTGGGVDPESGAVDEPEQEEEVVPAPGQPTRLLRSASNYVLALRWRAPANATGISGYQIRYRRSGHTDWGYVDSPGDGTSRSLPNLNWNWRHSYRYGVRARNASGYGEWSETYPSY